MKADLLSPLAENVLNRRLQFKLSESQLSVRSGVPRRTLHRLRRGQGEPNLATLYGIAAALKCEVWELLKPNTFTITGWEEPSVTRALEAQP